MLSVFYSIFNLFLTGASSFSIVGQSAQNMPNAPLTAIPGSTQVSTVPVSHGHVWLYFLEFIYVILCVALVLLVMFQVSKSEGIAGVMGGSMQNVFRGKHSAEQKISKLTNILAVVFVVFSMFICWLINMYGI